jgi:hypothetical protein
MLVFRILCSVLMAWAINYSLSRPEAIDLVQELPEMTTLAPIAGAVVGYFNLAVRQGWGVVVALANGIWAGVLSIFLSGVLFMLVKIVDAIRTNVIKNFDGFLNVFRSEVEPLINVLLQNVPMIIVSLGAAAVIGFVTELLHWVLVRMRQRKGSGQTSKP